MPGAAIPGGGTVTVVSPRSLERQPCPNLPIPGGAPGIPL
jgi:hypothetical protein